MGSAPLISLASQKFDTMAGQPLSFDIIEFQSTELAHY